MLSLQDNYCPECGQKNLDQRVSLSVFLQDFFSNYLSLDTTLFRTMKPFLFKPGKLTLEFNSGKRNFYIHPIRLYLIFSLFYFFIVASNVPVNSVDTMMNKFPSVSDTEAIFQELDSAERKELEQVMEEKVFVGLGNLEEKDTIAALRDSSISAVKWPQMKAYAIDDDISDLEFGEILDSQSDIYKILNSLGVAKTRTFIANSNLYLTNALRNLPIMMFILLPLFGLFLMLLHLRSKKFYIEHLIHAIHLHAFAYFLYGVGILLIFNINSSEAKGWIFFFSFVLVSLYTFLSIRKLYRNGFFKEFVKFTFLGFVYFFFLMIAVGFELYISLMLL